MKNIDFKYAYGEYDYVFYLESVFVIYSSTVYR